MSNELENKMSNELKTPNELKNPQYSTALNLHEMIESLFKHFQANEKIFFIKTLRTWYGVNLKSGKEIQENIWKKFGPKMIDGAISKKCFSQTFSELDQCKNDLRACQEDYRQLNNEQCHLVQDLAEQLNKNTKLEKTIAVLRSDISKMQTETVELLRENNKFLRESVDKAPF